MPEIESNDAQAAGASTDVELNEARALLARAQKGDEAAVRTLYQAHTRYLAGVVYRMMGADADVDDVVQETFLDGLAALSELKDVRALRGWLATIAVRRVHKLLARRRRRKTLLGIFSHVLPTHADVREGERVMDLYAALERVREDLRVPWTLARIEGWMLPDVAQACGVSLATVKRRIQEAESRLSLILGHGALQQGEP
jgi:RNA polymerase sigma-70 factor (ECF subfamily)